jgi:hypothetical protein
VAVGAAGEAAVVADAVDARAPGDLAEALGVLYVGGGREDHVVALLALAKVVLGGGERHKRRVDGP